MSNEFLQLAVSPLFILVTVAGVFHLILLRNEKGFIVNFGRVGSTIYIVVYLIALYFYIF